MKQGSIGNFFKRKLEDGDDNCGGSSKRKDSNPIPSPQTSERPQHTSNPTPSPQASERPQHTSTTPIPRSFNLDDLPLDPGDRPRITYYHTNQRDEIRRAYLIKGACQPKGHNFPSKLTGKKLRRFVVEWFDEFDWLEYSIKKNKAYCLCCYLFGDIVGQQGGRDAFVSEGFDTWSKKGALWTHIGSIDSYHNKAKQKCDFLLRKNQSISEAFRKQTELENSNYDIRLFATVLTSRVLLKNALPFRGHDESDSSLKKGLFLEILSLIRSQNESIHNVTLENAPKNEKLTSPTIQKDVIECFSKEVVKSICDEIGNDVFGILVDESSDVSQKEQMAIVLRYVDSLGIVKERFIGVVHVKDTSSLTLKAAIDSVFTENNLSMAQVRGQGYDGASNMSGSFNGLKSLILKENISAHYVHCFAHQLQLVIVAVAKKHEDLDDFFRQIALVVTVVCGSCKRKDMLLEMQKKRVEDEIGQGEIETGRGLNQEISIVRPGDTRWGSHYKTIMSLIQLFAEVLKVLAYIGKEGSTPSNRYQANGILPYFKTLDFVFLLHLMLEILCLTNTLSKHLQKKDQDILEAAFLVKGTKQALLALRKDGFPQFFEKVSSFCQKNNIGMVEMAEYYVTPRNRKTNMTNQHHFEVMLFNTALDMQIQEFGDRFSESMGALSPCDSFSRFDKSKLLKLSEIYKNDFDYSERVHLNGQLDIYYHYLIHDDKFANLKGIADLSRLMVETEKHRSFPLVYRLLKLALILPVATATVERCFSAMKLVKTDLRNRMGDDYMNGALICSVETEALMKLTDNDVMTRFRKMKPRRKHL